MKWEVTFPEESCGHDEGLSGIPVGEGKEVKEIRNIYTGDRIIPDPKQEVVFTRRLQG